MHSLASSPTMLVITDAAGQAAFLPYAALGGDGVFGFVVGFYWGREAVVVAAAEDVAAVLQFYHAHGGLCIFPKIRRSFLMRNIGT